MSVIVIGMISENFTSKDNLELEPSDVSIHSSTEQIPLAQLKSIMRITSINLNDPIRNSLWIQLSMRNKPLVKVSDFDTRFDCLTVNKLPIFVDITSARYFFLTSNARKKVATILWNLFQCM